MLADSDRHIIDRLDPAGWAKDALDLELDEWQADAMKSEERRIVFLCSRQSGKSTVAALKALHRVIFYPRSLVLLISPSLRQSSELFRKVLGYLNALQERPKLTEENKLSITLANGSRIVSLPSSEATIRGYSNAAMIIEDEAAAVPDELFHACLPMLAVSNGQYVMLSTPRGKRGHFFDAYDGGKWQPVTIKAEQIPRITSSFLADAKTELGSRMYAQEFECVFSDDIQGSMFRQDWFKICDSVPADLKLTRRWDLAAGGGDWTAGVLMGTKEGRFYVLDVQHAQLGPGANENLIRQTAALDGVGTPQRIEQEPGSSGVALIDRYAREVLKGYNFKGIRSTGPKVTRAAPFAAACEAGNVYLMRGPWNRAFIDELGNFPLGEHDDMVDAAAGAFSDLTTGQTADPSRFRILASC